jgi:XTP/dITP diphosphohydrolase
MTSAEQQPTPLRYVCASANPDKVAEIAEILDAVEHVQLLPRPADVPDVVEDADTLLGNARLKGAALARATGIAAIADDTGLEVDALGGAPGVITARYAGEGCSYDDNVTKLLHELHAVEPAARTARFRTVAIVVWPDGTELAVDGVCEGTIATERRGERGFGYDPVFIATDGDGRTFAQMSAAEKHELSHRGRAIRGLAAALAARGRAVR